MGTMQIRTRLFWWMLLAVSLNSFLMADKPVTGASYLLKSKQGYEKHFTKVDFDALVTSEKERSARVKRQSNGVRHAGQVYYKNGIKRENNSYVTTGRIVVEFDRESKITPEAFAKKYDLTFEKYIGRRGRRAVFINHSEDNDILLTNKVVNDKEVVSVQPDWVLPLKLY